MTKIKIGDIVVRKSYQKDIFLKVTDFFIGEDKLKYAKLKGIDFRLFVNAPASDLERIEPKEASEYWQNITKKSNKQINNIFNRRIKEQYERLTRVIKKTLIKKM